MSQSPHPALAMPACLAAALLVAACGWAEPAAVASNPAARAESAVSRAAPLPKVVSRSCQGCHSVRAHLPSPNPAAPGFRDIANMEGLTPTTLEAFLREAHNYPDEMKMRLTPQEVREITAYVLTLRDPNYRPVP